MSKASAFIKATTPLALATRLSLVLLAGCQEDELPSAADAGVTDGLVTPDAPIVEADVLADTTSTDDVSPDVAEDDVEDGGGGLDAIAETPCTFAADCAALMADRPCVIAACNGATHLCEVSPTKEGAPCDDGNACTEGTVCDSGVCSAEKAATITCSDFNPCTDNVCDPDMGCVASNNTAACNDGNTCTEADLCEGGACVGKATDSCSCATNADCAQFDDADLCNGSPWCVDGQCAVFPESMVTCPALQGLENVCVTRACEPSLGKCVVGLAAVGAICDDGDACTLGESCDAGGGCTPLGDAKCECGTDADCAEFDDDNPCNGVQRCVAGQCGVDPASVVTCPTSNDGSCAMPACNPTTGACDAKSVDDGQPCNDLDPCTFGDKCDAGACKPGTWNGCYDGEECTLDSCDAVIGCIHLVLPECLVKECTTDADCDDGEGGDDSPGSPCNEFGVGQSEPNAECAIPCNNNSDCPILDECSSISCVASVPGEQGACRYTPLPGCGPGPCTADADCFTDAVCLIGICDPTVGCLLASDPACAPGCEFDADCADEDACTTDVCDGTGTCQHLFDATCGGTPCTVDVECDDGEGCTKDLCDGVVCQHAAIADCGFASCTSAAECDDGQPCSIDACTPTLGCVHQLLQGCGGEKCTTAANCDDQNPCTNDVCTVSGTCKNNAVSPCVYGQCTVLTDCDDGNACTADFCEGDICLHWTVNGCKPDGSCTKNSECIDLDPCTVDFCSQGLCSAMPVTGCASGACQNASDCDDGDAGTADSREKKVLCVHNSLP